MTFIYSKYFNNMSGASAEANQKYELQALAMDNLDENQISSTLVRQRAEKLRLAKKEETKRKEQLHRLLIAMQQQLNSLNNALFRMEQGFKSQYGNAWREEIALQILSADDFPARRDGESMDDYRNRLEKHLIDELLTADGEIKEEYKNDPTLRRYAEWAQTVFNRNQAEAMLDGLKNGSVSPEELSNSEMALQAADKLEEYGDIQDKVMNNEDKKADEQLNLDQSDYGQSFLTFNR